MNRVQRASLWDAIIEYVRARQGERDVRVTAGYMDAIDRLVDEFIDEGRASRRDMFAAAALNGLLAHDDTWEEGSAAARAARHAEAMIAALDARVTGTEIEIEALAVALREMLDASDGVTDPKWADLHGAQARLAKARLRSRELLKDFADVIERATHRAEGGGR